MTVAIDTPPAPHRVLIIKPSSLGDVVTALPVLRALRRAHADCHIAWMLSDSCMALLDGDPDLDEIVPFRRRRLGKAWYHPGATGDLLGLLRRLRKSKFDWVIDLQGLFRSGFFARAAGASVRAGFADAREGAPLFYTHPVAADKPHTIDRNLAVAHRLGLDAGPEDLILNVPPAARQFAATIADEHGLRAGEFFVCVPPTRWMTKQLPVRRWRTVVADLVRDMPVVLLGGPAEVDLCREVGRGMPPGVIDLSGRTGLTELTGVIEASACVICSDSAAQFIAAAAGVDPIVLIGPTDPDRTGPYPRGRAIVADVPCRGCLKRHCSHITCMQVIDPSDVVAAARDTVSKRNT